MGSFLCFSRLKGSQLSASLGLSAGLAKTGLRFHVVAMGGWKKGGMGGRREEEARFLLIRGHSRRAMRCWTYTWPLAVVGQMVQVASGCWSNGSGGLWMLLVKCCRWPVAVLVQRVQVASGCCGLWLLLVKWFKWPLGVVGQSVQVASGRHKGVSHSLPGEAGLLPLKQSKLRTRE